MLISLSLLWGAALLLLARPATALAYLLYFNLLRSAGPSNLLLVTLLIPVSALALGILRLGEDPIWDAYAGLALILTGLITIDGRLNTPRATGSYQESVLGFQRVIA